METNLHLSTNIEIYQDNKLICHTHNILTSSGKGAIHKLLTSTASINKLALSYLTSKQTIDTPMYPDAVLKEIDNTYFTFSGGDIIMNFETEISGLTAGQIQRLGLAVGNNLLFTTANTGVLS